MRLSKDEYQRGVVKWQVDCVADLVVRSNIDGQLVDSAPMTDPSGSVPDMVSDSGGEVSLRPMSPGAFDGAFHIVWDRLVGDDVNTVIFDSQQGRIGLVGIPALGRFERLVVLAPHLRWEDEWVIRVNDAIVRFTNTVVLERQGSMEPEHFENRSTYTFGVATERLSGTLIEIVAPESIGNERQIVHSILGLLGLVLGDAAVGDVVQLDILESSPIGTQYEVRFPQLALPSAVNRTMRIPRSVRLNDADKFNQLLVHLFDDDAVREDTLLPLRWYERALRHDDDVDRFLAAFVGLEALVSRLSKRRGFVSPIADLLDDPQVAELLEPLRSRYEDEQVDRLLARLKNKSPSLLDRFNRLADEMSLGDQVKTEFRTAHDNRHPLVHGSKRRLDKELPDLATSILGKVLRIALRAAEAG